MSQKEDLLVLFQRPFEPSFFPKDDGNTVLELPPDYLPERYQKDLSITRRFQDGATKVIKVEAVSLPDLSFAKDLSVDESFCFFLDHHKKIAGRLVKILMEQPNVESLMSVAAYCKDRLNPYLFLYALSVAINHRGDTKDLTLPSIVETFPDQFFNPSINNRLHEEGKIPGNKRVEIEIPRNYTASEDEPEQKLAYFREDIGINSHHWHWHLVYPGNLEENLVIVDKDRRGELFFEMHSQVIARYNAERITHGMPLVKPLDTFRDPIPEGYYPKLMRGKSSSSYPGRPEYTILRDVNRRSNSKTNIITVTQLETWRDRIKKAIDDGYVFDKNREKIFLDNEKGIDILGNLVEASDLSVDREFYGNLHNMGHNLVSFCHDPKGKFLEDAGVMSDVATAMRDPIFYRWHAFLDELWLSHKNKLPEYPNNKLDNPGIKIHSLNLQIKAGNRQVEPNMMLTFWQKSKLNLDNGLDFQGGKMTAIFSHLQHAPFQYEIEILNTSGEFKQGTCRIYCCPKLNELGRPMNFDEKRYLMIEMDKFTVDLNPGPNSIRRRSNQSSITVPFDRMFAAAKESNSNVNDASLCGCGWPEHMLLPKGTKEGMIFEFVAQISNYADDIFDGPIDAFQCGDAHSFCGLKDKKYPDKRAMGYPFDRRHPSSQTLEDFVRKFENFALQEVVIKNSEETLNTLD